MYNLPRLSMKWLRVEVWYGQCSIEVMVVLHSAVREPSLSSNKNLDNETLRKYLSANSSATVFLNSSTSNGFSKRTSIESALLTLLKKA